MTAWKFESAMVAPFVENQWKKDTCFFYLYPFDMYAFPRAE
jgi:hypothetical protein